MDFLRVLVIVSLFSFFPAHFVLVAFKLCTSAIAYTYICLLLSVKSFLIEVHSSV